MKILGIPISKSMGKEIQTLKEEEIKRYEFCSKCGQPTPTHFTWCILLNELDTRISILEHKMGIVEYDLNR